MDYLKTGKEEEIARYWAEAAIPARHLDIEFAELCLYKSEAWINPDLWTHDKVVKYGIDLESVKIKYKAMLLHI